jgi:guanine nucleotide-binding protein G(i) subunit alpha
MFSFLFFPVFPSPANHPPPPPPPPPPQEYKEQKRQHKLLLLGAGESGKSTVAKQMKVIHMNGFTQDELISYKPVVHFNALTSMRLLLAANRKFGIGLSDETLEASADRLLGLSGKQLRELAPEYAEMCRALWADDGVKKVYARVHETQVPDSAAYCLNALDRIASPTYIPTTEDCLRCRSRTTGIVDLSFQCKRTQFRIIDVGGQRSERMKWIHCFEDVTAVIFCVALTGYSQRLYEDEQVNRMHEALELFDEVVNSRWFESSSIVLFFNKSDIFRKRIRTQSLDCCFDDYDGSHSYTNAVRFIRKKFVSLASKHRLASSTTDSDPETDAMPGLYTHITCATDTDNMRYVFDAVTDTILHNNLVKSGF